MLFFHFQNIFFHIEKLLFKLLTLVKSELMIYIPDSASLKFDSIYSAYILGVFLILSEFLFSLFFRSIANEKIERTKNERKRKKMYA